MKIRYLLHNAYGVGGTIRTVFNQANALCATHDVEIGSIFRTAETPAFPLDPRVRLVSVTDLRQDGLRWTGKPERRRRLSHRARALPNPLPHGRDFRYNRWDPMVDLKIIRYMRSQTDGILISTRPALNLLSAWFGPRRVTRIGQDHMNFSSYKPKLKAQIVRAYPKLDAVTVLTHADLESYRAAVGDKVSLTRIPNGIPPHTAPPADERAKVVVAAGRLFRQKGFDLLIDAWVAVRERHPAWQLHIFGEGKLRKRLAEQIAERGLGDVVKLRGVSRTLDAEFAKASVFVLSSRKEGLPMVLLEAMGAGLPVVAFDCPTGPADVVEDGVNGLLVPAEDVPGLAAGLIRVMDSPEDRESFGTAARVTAAGYEMPVIAAQWDELFRRVTRELAAG
ncbi:Glycosyltransferase involved in cell wall bisynthesis [Actinoplanes philippinensis]|uniref:Glycosyltransferase involved in cell wall bisynthesis n=1 Tax=Actinoplanes philippinensis TaxID=35752 RepID=A0A1I2LCX8_9ACTN|nr:glycosyltransferase family 4 protein [Actinoplanes philippinensis]SFF75041.1 Glycosyltransferase involved in cell wall bisynthesis [Actinoplanes philippinensis]